MTQYYTYLHCKPNGDPFYVGKGCGKRRSHDLVRRNKYHQNIVAKYGKENIGVFVFLCESEKQAFADEIQQIAQLRREGYELCNLTDGGDGPVNPTEEVRAKIRAARARQIISPEIIANLAKINKGNKYTLGKSPPNKGIPMSIEQKKKLSIGMIGKESPRKGVTLSIETKKKLITANIGKKYSVETRKKISKSLIGNKRCVGRTPKNKGIPMSDEQKVKMSIAMKKIWAEKKGGSKCRS